MFVRKSQIPWPAGRSGRAEEPADSNDHAGEQHGSDRGRRTNAASCSAARAPLPRRLGRWQKRRRTPVSEAGRAVGKRRRKRRLPERARALPPTAWNPQRTHTGPERRLRRLGEAVGGGAEPSEAPAHSTPRALRRRSWAPQEGARNRRRRRATVRGAAPASTMAATAAPRACGRSRHRASADKTQWAAWTVAARSWSRGTTASPSPSEAAAPISPNRSGKALLALNGYVGASSAEDHRDVGERVGKNKPEVR